MDGRERVFNLRLRIGQVAGIEVFVHWTLLALAAWQLFQWRDDLRAGLLGLVALWISILLHELGHCWGARRMGGDAREVLLWPLGGLASVQVPESPWPQFFMTAAGPAVNVLLLAIHVPLLYLLGGELRLGLWPVRWIDPTSLQWFVGFMVAWNAMLALFNLIPAFPMDGGRILQTILWPRLGFQRALEIAVYAALVCAGGMAVVALVQSPVSFILLGIAVFVVVTSLQERERFRYAEMGGASPWAASLQGYGYQERVERRSAIGSWMERRRARRARADAQRKTDMRRRLDEILEKVSRDGMTSLTREERRFLERASNELRKDLNKSGS